MKTQNSTTLQPTIPHSSEDQPSPSEAAVGNREEGGWASSSSSSPSTRVAEDCPVATTRAPQAPCATPNSPNLQNQEPRTRNQEPSSPSQPARNAALITLALSDPTLSARITQILAPFTTSTPAHLDAARPSLRHLSEAAAIPYRILRHASRALRLPILSRRSTTGDREPHLTLTRTDAQTLLAFALGRHHKADLRHRSAIHGPAPLSQGAPAVAPACSPEGRDAAPPASQTSRRGQAEGGAEPIDITREPTPLSEGAPAVAPARSPEGRDAAPSASQTSRRGQAEGGAEPIADTHQPAPVSIGAPTVAPACSPEGTDAAPPASQTSRRGQAEAGAEPIDIASPERPEPQTASPVPRSEFRAPRSNPSHFHPPLSRKGLRGPRARQTPIPSSALRVPSSATSDLRSPTSDFSTPAPRTAAILAAAAADPQLTAKIDSILAHAQALGVHTRHAAQRPDNTQPSEVAEGTREVGGRASTLNPQRVSLNALGEAAAMPRSSLHHAVKQLRITTQLERRATGRGRRYATISTEEARTVLAFVFGPRPSTRSAQQPDGPKPYTRQGLGHLYLCLLEPDADSGRFKIGWTGALGNRLSKFLCSTPFGEYLHHWPCLRQWELTARAYITRDCEHIREEVYRTRDLPALLSRAAHFFTEMPDPSRSMS